MKFQDYLNENQNITEASSKELVNKLIELMHLFQGDYGSEKEIKMLDWSEVDPKTINDMNKSASILIKHMEY